MWQITSLRVTGISGWVIIILMQCSAITCVTIIIVLGGVN